MWLLSWLVIFSAVAPGMAQSLKMSGDYSGMLGPLHLKLHLKVSRAGRAQATLDSLDQGAMGLPCANLHSEGSAFSFDVPSVGGSWRGSVSDDGATLGGKWAQGQEIPLVFHRDPPFDAALKPSAVDGIWLGTLAAGGTQLRLQLQVKSDRSGKEYCSLDSLDQGAMGLSCDQVQFAGNQFAFQVPSVRGHWSGTLAEGGNEISGTWSQGSELPLRFTRQATAIAPKPPEPPKFDAALPPVSIDELRSVLDRDLGPSLQHGALAPATNAGVVIGVVKHGIRRTFAFGAVKDDDLFEIGSISKTFTGLLLAQMVAQHRVNFDEPVRALLPEGTVAKPDGAEITLLDLATQHSGLPRLPDNFHPADPQNPYADYRAANLYEFLAKHGVAKPADPGFGYSNLGLGLLGQALANRAGTNYAELLHQEITGPLGMTDTVVVLSPEQQKRFAQGHDAQHQPAHAWHLEALVGAGGIRSTANDMLSYLEAQLHPDQVARLTQPGASNEAKTLPQAVPSSHGLRADAFPKMKVALVWLYREDSGTYWHNGATGGYSSYALFNPKEDFAVVVLFNTSIGPNGSFADMLGEHMEARLSGKPAISVP